MSQISDRAMRFLIGVLFVLAVISFAIAILLPVNDLIEPTQKPMPALDVSNERTQGLETLNNRVFLFDEEIYIGEV